jgi:hypothetical protein
VASRLTQEGGARLRKAHEADPAAVGAQTPPAVTFQPAAAETPPASPPAAVEPLALPDPHEPLSTGEKLNARERKELAVCEGALDRLRQAFWDAGQGLEVIRAGRHYKETHKSFEGYVEERWGMRRAQADRLIRGWRLGRKLDPIGSSFGARVVESHVRPLLPVSDAHGDDAATAVYRVTAEVTDGKVTAVALQDAVEVLPDDWDVEEARLRIRARLVDGIEPTPAGPVVPPGKAESAAEFVTAASKAWAALKRAAHEDFLRAAADTNPGYVRKFVGDLRGLADQLEKEIP